VAVSSAITAVLSTGQHTMNNNFLSISPPPYLEDENVFQKLASVVQILAKFNIQSRRPIFDSPQNKTSFFPVLVIINIGTR
jgi:hypothetical protein